MGLRVVIAGGGTAGHVFPGLALARTLESRGHDVSFVGTARGLEARLVPAAGFEFREVEASPFVRRISLAAVRAPFAALRAVRHSREALGGADVAVGMGGYVSVPAVLGARREKVPVVLHEQNAVPGLANRALGPLARSVALSFAAAAPSFIRRVRRRTTVTGNPVREEILRVASDREALAAEARREFGLEEGRRTVVIFGGSQGALHIDRATVGAAKLLGPPDGLQILLITGPAHLELIEKALSPASGAVPVPVPVRTVGYVERMDLAYAAADLVVSRAGATSIAELSVVGLPAILIPYPYATGRHQEANARAMQRAGGASVLMDDELSAETLATRVESLVGHDERLRAMADGSRAFGRPDAAARLADLVEAAAR
jgi:UDP-N-acetylglucosamine--N-acetylmuramyl-(pentapeptide) pyrophosphoryl-undecaprenol N-acetylglucosamine transferase